MGDCFVFSELVKPGTHSVIIYDPLTDEFYWRMVAVKPRSKAHVAVDHVKPALVSRRSFEGEPDNVREIRKKIFKDFKVDSSSILKLALLKDTNPELFKPYKFMRSTMEIERCIVEIHKNYQVIKNAFLILAVESHRCYPNIDEGSFRELCHDRGVIDHLFTEQDLTAVFAETNFEYVEDVDDNNPDDLLNRSEFLEIFMRIAVYKNGATVRQNAQDHLDIERALETTSDPAKQEQLLNRKAREVLAPAEWLRYFIEHILAPLNAREDIAGFRQNSVHNDSRVCNVLMKNYTSLTKMFNS